ncbi:MAG TPA: membrane dipeptidase [Burkholderiales bacterium]|nr:membrane dipeptidase [Burkholderiales bacterium]
MRRRDFVGAAVAAGIFPFAARAQSGPPRSAARFADMHAHLGFRWQLGYREQMEAGGLLLVAEAVTSEGGLLRPMGGRLQMTRDVRPGELRANFDGGFRRRRQALVKEGLVEVSSAAALDHVLKERTPGLVLAAEGADFLDGDLAYLDKMRSLGLVHLQLVHYYPHSLLGDISTEAATQGGMTPFGLDVVRACNRLGMLVDVAHCTNQGMLQVLDVAKKPVVYSHGHVSAGMPSPSQGGSMARAVYAPVAKRIAEKGGVVGIWPDWYTYANLDLMADGIARAAEQLGAAHVGIGSDMHGLTRTIMPGYGEFAALEPELSKRGLKPAEVEGIMGGNYLRVLRDAMTI